MNLKWVIEREMGDIDESEWDAREVADDQLRDYVKTRGLLDDAEVEDAEASH